MKLSRSPLPALARAGPNHSCGSPLRCVWRACWLLWLWLLAGAAAAQPLVADGRDEVPVWPSITVMHESGQRLSPEQALALPNRFARPEGTSSNLGRTATALWLRFTVFVPGAVPIRRVLEVDYPSLNEVDVFVVGDGRVIDHHRMGNGLRRSERALPTRTHAAPLVLPPGEHVVLMRVQTLSSLVLPITLRTLESFTVQESRSQLVLGVMIGLAMCMMLYSLTHWLGLRDSLFLEYAVLLAGNVVFVLAYFGIGAQYLWPDWPALSARIAPMAVMVAIAAGARFMATALAVHEVSRFVARVLQTASVGAMLALAASLLGLLDYRAGQSVVTVLGLSTTAAVLPVAFVRARRGERAAQYMLVGWAFYTVGALVTAGLLRGLVEPTTLAQQTYPMSLMVEMAAWMAVLSLRVQEIHRNADRARLETETLRTLAQTDALTGLPNRRGLQREVAKMLPHASSSQLLALYLLDLDGFKPVNDRHGHDVGDALLVEVGRRLQSHLRGADVVARLGGDEFVVLAAGLPDEAAAATLGQKMLSSFDAPFDAAGKHCEVGLTIGFAIAPLDGREVDDLLKRADAAMYAGKQAGRRRVQRGGRSLAAA